MRKRTKSARSRWTDKRVVALAAHPEACEELATKCAAKVSTCSFLF
jgi:hypothetical protein